MVTKERRFRETFDAIFERIFLRRQMRNSCFWLHSSLSAEEMSRFLLMRGNRVIYMRKEAADFTSCLLHEGLNGVNR